MGCAWRCPSIWRPRPPTWGWCLQPRAGAAGAAHRLQPPVHPGRCGRGSGQSMGVETFGIHGATAEEYEAHLIADAGVSPPHLIIDDGGDLVDLLGGKCAELLPAISSAAARRPPPASSACRRLEQRRAMLRFPMMAGQRRRLQALLFDNRYGTGQSVWDGIMRTTNLIVAGKDRRGRRLRLVRQGRGHAGRRAWAPT